MSDEQMAPLREVAERARLAMEKAAAEDAARRASPEYQRAQAERAEKEQRRREADRRERVRASADDAQIPEELGLRTIALMDDPPKTEALTAYRDALEWRDKNSTQVGRRPVVRLVAGTAGSGKSCALAWCATHHRRSAEFVSASRVAATPRNGWSENEAAWSRWLRVDLLCIDEAGCEKGDTAALALLIAERYNHGLATLLSGNISRKDFTERYRDERLADRLKNGQGMGGGPEGLSWYVQVTGDSLRNPANVERLIGAQP
jgi:DNA replication protein DnaC